MHQITLYQNTKREIYKLGEMDPSTIPMGSFDNNPFPLWLIKNINQTLYHTSIETMIPQR